MVNSRGIKRGDSAVINKQLFMVEQVNGEWAFLRGVRPDGKMQRGRSKKVLVDTLVVMGKPDPPIIHPKRPKVSVDGRINLGPLLKENSDLSISNATIAFARENLETLMLNLLDIAERNARSHGRDTIGPEHWYVLQLRPISTYPCIEDHTQVLLAYDMMKAYQKGDTNVDEGNTDRNTISGR